MTKFELECVIKGLPEDTVIMIKESSGQYRTLSMQNVRLVDNAFYVEMEGVKPVFVFETEDVYARTLHGMSAELTDEEKKRLK